MKIKDWNIEEITGYKPMTTFYTDFGIAETFGVEAVKSTYAKAFEKWKDSYKYITELVMVLNWKIFEHYENNDELAKIYNDLWEELDNWCLENLKDDELSYFIKVTD